MGLIKKQASNPASKESQRIQVLQTLIPDTV